MDLMFVFDATEVEGVVCRVPEGIARGIAHLLTTQTGRMHDYAPSSSGL